MTAIHQAFLFSPEEFASHVESRIHQIDSEQDGYDALIKTVLDLFATSPNVRYLAGEFGGWDMDNVQNEIRNNDLPRLEAIGFCITLLIYNYLNDVMEYEIGLGSSRDRNFLEQALYSLDWDQATVDLLINGQTFKDFAKNYLYSSGQTIPSYWEYVEPYSTSSHIGWINESDVSRLLDRLNQDQPKVVTVGFDTLLDVTEIYKKAAEMLALAKEYETGLCLIISG